MDAPLDSPWNIELLGGLRLTQGDRTVTRFRTQTTAALLAYLALYSDRTHGREALMDRFWGDEPLDVARNRFRVALNSLRKQLEPPGVPFGGVLVADRARVGLNPRACETDVARFHAALAAAPPGSLDETTRLERAVALYRDDLLPDFYDDWIAAERERLVTLHRAALLRLSRLHKVAGNDDRAAHYARRASERESLDAGTRLAPLTAAPASVAGGTAGRDSAPPIAARDSVQDAPHTDPAPGHAPPAVRLPLSFTPFFGRGAEGEQIRRALFSAPSADNSRRLLTLTGPGGTGKTRLAIETARTLAAEGTATPFFAPLSEARDGRAVREAIALSLGLPRRAVEEGDAAIAAALRAAHAPLLILDNCEQLAAVVGAAAVALLSAVPELRILATSRRRLELPGESEMPIAPLPLPAALQAGELAPALDVLAASPAVALFVHRAQASRADFALTARNAADVAAVCRAVEGLPLALELAAARIWASTPGQMRAQLGAASDATQNRFYLLASAKGDKPNRHRSLWAAIAWSYDLLPPPLQRFFAQISVFRGGCTVSAAQAVCEEPFAAEYLAQLRAHSLLAADEAESEGNGEPRFRLLESLREFAAERLTADDLRALAARHAAYFLRLADQAQMGLRSAKQSAWLDRLDAEQANLRAALAGCAARAGEDCTAGETGLLITAYLTQYWLRQGPLRETADYLRDLLPRVPDASAVTRALALNTLGSLLSRLGDYENAGRALAESESVYRSTSDSEGLALALANRGVLAGRRGDAPARNALAAESLALRLRIGDRWGAAGSYLSIGAAAHAAGNLPAAAAAYEKSLAVCREIGDARGTGAALLNLANAAVAAGDTVRARTLYDESLAIARAQRIPESAAIVLINFGGLLAEQDEPERAEEYLGEALTLCRRMGDRPLEGSVRVALAHLARERERPEAARVHLAAALDLPLSRHQVCAALDIAARLAVMARDASRAVRLYAAVAAVYAAAGMTRQANLEAGVEEKLASLRESVGEARFDRYWAEGEAMSEERVRDLALGRG